MGQSTETSVVGRTFAHHENSRWYFYPPFPAYVCTVRTDQSDL